MIPISFGVARPPKTLHSVGTKVLVYTAATHPEVLRQISSTNLMFTQREYTLQFTSVMNS